MANKKFTSNKVPEVFYEVVGEKWMDKNTYLVVFQTMTDEYGEHFHLEAEYHKDDCKIYYSRCYEYEVSDGRKFVSQCFKKQIEEYILQQVGVLREGSFATEQETVVWLKLDVPNGTSVEELREFLNSLKFEVVHTKTPRDEKIKVLSIETAKRRV